MQIAPADETSSAGVHPCALTAMYVENDGWRLVEQVLTVKESRQVPGDVQ